ncbi:paraquat-inducible protein A [Paraglaciecola sp. 20A4]|uniref:paraquat-inducible protein A n=1 Tax=Paraglaciecola sp. 20A4 TaxID=2687288 RepID=UPI00140E80AF|nr:paraquat-inducible protein A [Paraglaciecola sp. 20A4]
MDESIKITTTCQQVHCHECGYLVEVPPLVHRQRAQCPRCHYVITTYYQNMVQKLVAFSVAALIFMVAALSFKFLSFSANGQYHSINIFSSIETLADNNYLALAILQSTVILVLPVTILLCLLYLLMPVLVGKKPTYAAPLLKFIFALRAWTMVEIFLVAVLVSLVKIMSMADIGIGLSFYAYALFAICMTYTLMYLDEHQMYLLTSCALPKAPKRHSASHSIQTTWALLFTSVLLYIPANVLPIMHTDILGDDEPSTILGGVLTLWKMGSYPIAAIIFIASILVPIAKFCILCWLNYTVQNDYSGQKKTRMISYRLTEFIGRWSMIDVFVVAILVSLIQLGNIMSIYPGYAALAFCAVVILTMLAAISFDTKLIWSNQ